MGKFLFNGYRVSFTQDGKVLEICCTTLGLYVTILYCALKNVFRGYILRYVFFTTIKK